MSEEKGKSSLNSSQENAILTSEGPVLIVAGAGSGKTMVLTHRISHLIEKGVKPWSILAITFTNKAAEEMRSRVNKLISAPSGKEYSGPWVGTFHSFAVYLLRNSGRKLGLPRHFSILDEEDSLSLIKECLKETGLDPNPPAGRAGKFEARKLRSIISRKKNELENVGTFEPASSYFGKIILTIWQKYEEKKEKIKSLDFDDLLLKAVELFSKNPEILDEWQERFKYIHIDEYQDTNLAQYHLTKLLAAKYRNLCVVGDIDQAIYSWRGADFRNILHFERDWPDAKIITLEENYRSTQIILDAANAVIVKNKSRIPKNLFTNKKSGHKITIFEASNEEEEAQFISEMSRHLIEKGISPKEIAVLFRTNFQSRILEEKMLGENISYQVVGIKFYERKEIKDILAYIKAALNGGDLLSLKRTINFPPRGIGKVLITKILSDSELSKKEREKYLEFEAVIIKIKKLIEEKKPSEVIKELINVTGLEEYFSDGTEEGEMRLANIKELVTIAKRYDIFNPPEGITKLLEDAALMSDQDTVKDEENSIKLMTVHAAKGLEFKAVFIAGLEEGLFPHQGKAASDGGEPRPDSSGREEERRLFYVALTRSKERLFLSYAVFRTIFGERKINSPSSFLLDIPEDLLERDPVETIMLD